MKKIAITGTKGKTTATYFISEILSAMEQQVLSVTTTGHFLNGERRSTTQDSLDIWGLVPTVAPGRYLYEFRAPEYTKTDSKNVAVLECSLGCSTVSGMGYAAHTVGVFLNVYEDHLGSTDRLKTKADIAAAKSFIFQRLSKYGWAVGNADDALVMKALKDLSRTHAHLEYSILPFGKDFTHFDANKHLENGGGLITLQDKTIVYKTKERVQEIIDTRVLPWTFNGTFAPSLYNLMAAVAAIIAYNEGKVPARLTDCIAGVRLDPNEGRLALFQSANGVKILADFAHEKISLAEVAKLGRTLADSNGKVIGVVRLAYDRTDDLITETGHAIANEFDEFVVYDKIDGHFKKPQDNLRSAKFQKQRVGHVSAVLAQAIKEKNPACERVVREDHAAKRAAEIARPGDVVVYIVNNDITRSNSFIKKYFKAELV